jgi:hypothetical protein
MAAIDVTSVSEKMTNLGNSYENEKRAVIWTAPLREIGIKYFYLPKSS